AAWLRDSKSKLFDESSVVRVICGRDAYRDLPRLLVDADSGQRALSLEETYADVNSIRAQPESPAAFVSIMRGCDNHCAFCVVPQTRGRERSTPADAVADQVGRLVDGGVREVTLLGQNVNSYRDVSSAGVSAAGRTPGFSAVYAERIGGLQFPDLLDRLSAGYPACRFRFTSPHPKDFPASLLQLIGERPNLARQLHLPAQSGSTAVLQRMRRGYSREAYLRLVDDARAAVPNLAITGISSADSAARRRLITRIRWSCCGCVRERTRAHRLMKDDVPEEVKMRRSAEVDRVFRDIASADNQLSVGQRQLVLIEGDSRRSADWWRGRNDQGIRVLLPKLPQSAQRIHQFDIRVGDFVAARVDSAGAQTLLAEPLAPVPDGPAGSNNMHALLEAKACLIHSALSRPVDGQQVVNCSELAKKLVLAEEKARRQYIENTRNAKLRPIYKLDEEKLQSDFRVLKFIGCELFSQTLPDHVTKSELVDFVITVYGNGRECSVSQRLFQLIDGQNSGRVNQLDLTIYCEPILTKPVLQELAGLGQSINFDQFKRLNITNAYNVRERTRAHRLMKDDVPEEVKMRRSAEVDRVFRDIASADNQLSVGQRQLVLIEGDSRRSADWWRGRNDQGIRVLLPKLPQSAQRIHQFDIRVGDFVAARVDSAGAQTLLAEPLAPVPDGPAGRPVDGQQVVNCSELAKKLVLAEEKARRQYIENTRNAKLRPIYKLDEEKLQSDFRVLKFIGCELFSQTLPDHVTKSELVDFVITVYGNGRECSVSQRLFQLIDGQNSGRVNQLDLTIYCEPILTKPVLQELAGLGQSINFDQFKRLNITNAYKKRSTQHCAVGRLYDPEQRSDFYPHGCHLHPYVFKGRSASPRWVLTPLLWNLVMDELLTADVPSSIVKAGYADDVAAIVSGPDTSTLRSLMQQFADKAQAWATRRPNH
uniref:CK5P1 protein n=1 Tax=Macrostomum lignano TaxID=282301 RepID=A0A1I8JMG5_9PLAT